jgi:site-specific recombinase XerD
LIHAFERVTTAWQQMADRPGESEQSLDKFTLLLARFSRYVSLRGAALVTDVDQDLAEDFITAPGRTRHGHVTTGAPATWLLRRSVLRAVWRTLIDLGLADVDPTRRVQLPARQHGHTRPLTEDEAIALRHHASFVDRPTRHERQTPYDLLLLKPTARRDRFLAAS